MKSAWTLLAAVCALVIGVYAYMSLPGDWEKFGLQKAADSSYNLLVQGFRAGQLSLKKEVPVGLTQLADPYDPAANGVYRFSPPYLMHDLCYYKGRLYLYHGVTPALILFWPYTVLTGDYLSYRLAVTIFCAIGFLASVGLLRAVWRRYFAEVSVGVVVACAVALGLAAGTLAQLSQASFYQVAISCGYMLTMLALGAVWCALHDRERGWRWLAVASLTYGLAVGARPNLLFGAVVLLVPVAQAWRERRQVGKLLMAATGPIVFIGLGLMLYNTLRFNNPFEFGWHYVLSGGPRRRLFDVRYLWFNFRIYFLAMAGWSRRFPFVHQIAVPHLPSGYDSAEGAYGVLTNIPVVWLALAVPLAWRVRMGQAWSALHWFVVAVVLLFGMCVLPLGLYATATMRFEVDFLPALVLLAIVGVFGLERTSARQPVRRRLVRWGWSVLLGFSVAFNLLATAEHYAEAHTIRGDRLGAAGRQQEAIEQYEQALRIEPDYARAQNNLGYELLQVGKIEEAIAHDKQALRLKPDSAEAHYNLGLALAQAGRIGDAIAHYEQALRIKPDLVEAHYNYGVTLQGLGKVSEAMGHYEQALRLNPDYTEAHYNLGLALAQAGRIEDAIAHYEQALRLNPDYAEAHNDLGIALVQAGRIPEAIEHLQQALRIKPDSAEAHYNLGIALVQAGRIPEAIEHLQQALRIKPDSAEAHYNLGIALMQAGRTPEAIEHLQRALRIKPDFTPAQNTLARLQPRQ
jgi:tetratricopeptide (TPR) repeat protein